ncbi:unnamed protein product [Phytophthora lilii]|uniref:Unnamed protein product n=1 Tax=Phytophthora lilii TaxID=2077276 RepID=A0A9W6TV96_9STRA|nr:unnamed protein product [Phytophthora lilii]
MKDRFTVNPFSELSLTAADKESLIGLANDYIMSSLKNKKLKIYSIRPESLNLATPDEATGAGLPTIQCVGTKEGKLDDLMFGIISEDLETMRMKVSYVNGFSAAAVLDGVVMSTIEDPFQSLVVKWMELDILLKSTGLIKNRDYIYLEGIGIVKNSAGERLGYSLLHSVNLLQTHDLPGRVRGNISFFFIAH